MLADGDGEADLCLAADGDHAMGVEPAVGPHRESSTGPGVSHPSHRLTQEVGGAPGGVGPALPQPGHQHVAGASGHGEERVIAWLREGRCSRGGGLPPWPGRSNIMPGFGPCRGD